MKQLVTITLALAFVLTPAFSGVSAQATDNVDTNNAADIVNDDITPVDQTSPKNTHTDVVVDDLAPTTPTTSPGNTHADTIADNTVPVISVSPANTIADIAGAVDPAPVGPITIVNDMDGDGIDDSVDNCIEVFNPDQLDTDGDGIGDVCDDADNAINPPVIVTDSDNDGIDDINDNCPTVPNPDQLDTDDDGVGDVCDDADNVVVTSPSDNGSGGGGGILSSSRSDLSDNDDENSDDDSDDSEGEILGESTTDDEGQVEGETTMNSCNPLYLTDYLHVNAINNPVQMIRLQAYLMAWEDADVVLNARFDDLTLKAVMDYQAKYREEILAPWGGIDPTGYVYITTRNHVNETVCDNFEGDIPETLTADENVYNAVIN